MNFFRKEKKQIIEALVREYSIDAKKFELFVPCFNDDGELRLIPKIAFRQFPETELMPLTFLFEM